VGGARTPTEKEYSESLINSAPIRNFATKVFSGIPKAEATEGNQNLNVPKMALNSGTFVPQQRGMASEGEATPIPDKDLSQRPKKDNAQKENNEAVQPAQTRLGLPTGTSSPLQNSRPRKNEDPIAADQVRWLTELEKLLVARAIEFARSNQEKLRRLDIMVLYNISEKIGQTEPRPQTLKLIQRRGQEKLVRSSD
jgi:hypothetical protein